MLRELRYGVHSDKSFFPYTYHKGCGDPDGAIRGACKAPGLQWQGVPDLALLSRGSRRVTCGRCHQDDHVLSLVAEMRGEEERLRASRDSEEEIF